MSEARPTSTVTVTCWGCNASETHPMRSRLEYFAEVEDLFSRGWMRRAFTQSSWDRGPWFCSEECAYESFNAKRAEEYEKNKELDRERREFEKYCRDTAIPRTYFAVFGLLVAGLSAYLLRGFIQ